MLECLLKFFPNRKIKYNCGHIGRAKEIVKAFDQDIVIQYYDTRNPEYCPQCLASMAIRCAWCGKIILPNNPITLYSPQDPDKTPLLEGARAYLCENGTINYEPYYGKIPENYKLVYVGCLR